MNSTDIAIIGAGFFGTCAALLLSKQGYSVTLFTEEKKPLDSCLHSLGVLWPSLNDPPTRAHVAHGHDVALYLNQFCQLGVDFFSTYFIQNNKLDYWVKSPCLRIGIQDFEQEELEKAKNLGFGLKNTLHKEIYEEQYPSYICTNALAFQQHVIKMLELQNVAIRSQKVTSLTERQNEALVHFEKESLKCEIIILAQGVGISNLLPKYKSILVPMSDILIEYECATQKMCPPVTLRASNGHVAASLFSKEDKKHLKITGPRFLLPQAGVGLVFNKENITPATLANVKKFHEQVFTILSLRYGYNSVENFLKDFPFELANYSAHVDCHPCDELPLVGEFGKLGKVLGCTGFLATGFSSGVWGAKIVEDLITTQKSSALHKRLQPRRFIRLLA